MENTMAQVEQGKKVESIEEHKNSKKKLVLLIEAMGGGVFTYMVDLANELTVYYDVTVVYGIRKQTPKDYKRYFLPEVQLIKIEHFTRAIKPMKDYKAYQEVKKVIKTIQPDLLHTHSSKAGVIGRVLGMGMDVPLFYTPHGYSFLMKEGKKVSKMLYFMIEWALGKINCTTIACSEGEYRTSQKVTKRSCFVNNSVNTKKLKGYVSAIVAEKKDIEMTMDDVVIYTMGRICTQKNPTLFNQIAEAMPHMKFMWIGDGELREELTSPNITITGWGNRKEALQYGAKCSIFILPSLWEGLPISLLESMSMKKICLVSDVVGNRDVIQHGVNGFVCSTLEEYLSALHFILQKKHRTQVEDMIQEAYQNIQDSYDTKLMGKEYDRVYRKYAKEK